VRDSNGSDLPSSLGSGRLDGKALRDGVAGAFLPGVDPFSSSTIRDNFSSSRTGG
jgi:hypothetical protein